MVVSGRWSSNLQLNLPSDRDSLLLDAASSLGAQDSSSYSALESASLSLLPTVISTHEDSF